MNGLRDMLLARKNRMVTAETALPGREVSYPDVPERHEVLGTPLQEPYPTGLETAYFGLGCFWGAEKLFWNLPGVYTTAVGYQGGFTPNPTYEEVCTGQTGHTEAVKVVYDPAKISYGTLLKHFYEDHNPTQGMRQGNDMGTQYRSTIYYTNDDQRKQAEEATAAYQQALTTAGFGEITTEIAPAGPFWYAEDYHQQYLIKVPNGYCPHHGTGIGCPAGLGVASEAESAGV
ncbi:MAG: peptide-methionine (S)-S-oxide reductase MsrA [Thermomicrobiales bacterium]